MILIKKTLIPLLQFIPFQIYFQKSAIIICNYGVIFHQKLSRSLIVDFLSHFLRPKLSLYVRYIRRDLSCINVIVSEIYILLSVIFRIRPCSQNGWRAAEGNLEGGYRPYEALFRLWWSSQLNVFINFSDSTPFTPCRLCSVDRRMEGSSVKMLQSFCFA